MGSIENRLRRLEEKAPAEKQEPAPAFIKLRTTEDIPRRELGPGYTHAQLYALAAERASAKAGAEVFPLEAVPAAVEALVALHEARGGNAEAVADRGA